MARKQTDRKRKNDKKSSNVAPISADGHQTSQQESEYQNLLKRVEARKDADQIKRIANEIDKQN